MRVVLCNCSPAEAEQLAEVLVREGLAACVNIFAGVRSVYVWEGRLEKDEESTLLIKVAADRVDALRMRLTELHSYDTVEVLSLRVEEAESDPRYIAWVRAARAMEG